MKLEDLKKIASGKATTDDIIKQIDVDEKEDEVVRTQKGNKVKSYKSYKSLVKTDKMYQGQPVYEIEFSNGLKILGAKINGHLMELQPKERLYKDVVNDSLAEWMGDSATKSRNRWWQSYFDKNGFPEVDR